MFSIFRIIIIAIFLLQIHLFGYSQNNVYKLKTVVIDAGHGGKDPGAVGKLGYEKNITLAIALKTGKYIQEKIPGVKVIYTRSKDEFIELHERAAIANRNNADLFISIHVNASTNPDAYGTDTWIMGLHKSKANLEVAKRENKVIMVEDNYNTKYQGMSADSTEAIIIHTMMQSANLEQSALLASIVQSDFRESVKRKDRGVHTAPFMVLWRTSMPSILIETGFLSNPEEEKFLVSAEGQDLIASAIYRAFKEYKTKVETKTNVGITEKQLEALEKQNESKPEIKPTTQEKDTIKPIPTEKPITVLQEPTKELQKKDSTTTPLNKTDLIDKFANQLQNDSINKTAKPIEVEKVVTKPLTQTQQIEAPKPITQPIIKNEPKISEPTKPIETNKHTDIIYTIQISVSKSKLEQTNPIFKGLQNIQVIQEDGWYKYSVGTYYSYSETIKNLPKVKASIPDSFIVARKNGVKLPLQEAKQITQ